MKLEYNLINGKELLPTKLLTDIKYIKYYTTPNASEEKTVELNSDNATVISIPTSVESGLIHVKFYDEADNQCLVKNVTFNSAEKNQYLPSLIIYSDGSYVIGYVHDNKEFGNNVVISPAEGSNYPSIRFNKES